MLIHSLIGREGRMHPTMGGPEKRREVALSAGRSSLGAATI